MRQHHQHAPTPTQQLEAERSAVSVAIAFGRNVTITLTGQYLARVARLFFTSRPNRLSLFRTQAQPARGSASG